jgi:Skp family chaperone for outer membrane proteins
MRTLLGWLLTIGCVLTAHAQAFGVVDYERIINESTFVKTSLERLQALEARYRGVLQTLQENIVLTNEERQELVNLLLAENLNDAQRKRVEQLTQTARQRANELQQLRQKPQPTETEKAALERFTQMEAVGREAIQSLAQQLSQQLDQQLQQSREQVRKAVRDTIAQVAKEKKLSLVFSAEAVLYAENDITNDVIKRLNERKQGVELHQSPNQTSQKKRRSFAPSSRFLLHAGGTEWTRGLVLLAKRGEPEGGGQLRTLLTRLVLY